MVMREWDKWGRLLGLFKQLECRESDTVAICPPNQKNTQIQQIVGFVFFFYLVARAYSLHMRTVAVTLNRALKLVYLFDAKREGCDHLFSAYNNTRQ